MVSLRSLIWIFRRASHLRHFDMGVSPPPPPRGLNTLTTGMTWVTPSPESITVPVRVLSPTWRDVQDAAKASTAYRKKKGNFLLIDLSHVFLRKRCQHEAGAMSKRIPTSLNMHIFYTDYYEQGLKLLWRAVSNQCSFSERIHPFCMDGRPICVKKCAV